MATFLGGALQGAQGGLSKLAAALAGGQGAYQQGFDDQVQAQSKIAQALAATRASDANAAHASAQADLVGSQRRVLDSRPELYEEQAALAAGTDIPTLRAFRERTRTGVAPQVPMGPETEDGSTGVGSAQFPPQLQSGLARSLQQFLPVLANSGDLKPDDLAAAARTFRDMGLSDEVIAGRADRNTVGGAQAAAGGKDLFTTNTAGTVLDTFSGALNETGGLARSSIAENRAQAANAQAQADRARDRGDARGAAPAGYRWTVDGNLERIPGGPADVFEKKGAPTEDERKAAGWFQQAQFAFDNMEEVLKRDPSAAKPQALPSMAGAIPGVGPAIRQSLNSDARQQFEQAAESFAEAALRAATGAGVNRDEARQKIAELTPIFGDKPGNIAQKKRALSVYLESLRTRAGRALPQQEAPAQAPTSRTPMGPPRNAPTPASADSGGRPPLSSFQLGG